MNAYKNFTPSLVVLICLFTQLSGQNVSYSVTGESFAPLAGKSSSASYAQFSAVEPFGGLSVSNLPDFKNFSGLIGQLPPLDQDGDGISDVNEQALGTDKTKSDTDGDGLTDGEEKAIGTNPLSTDTDEDGYSDFAEINAQTDPKLASSKPASTRPPESPGNPPTESPESPSSPPNAPAVEFSVTTLKPILDGQRITLLGNVQSDLEYSSIETGFLLSNDILFENNNSQEKIIADLEGKSFSAKITITEFDKSYYARAYAVIGGETKVGKIARIRLDGPYDAPFNAQLVDSGWYESDWFGTFKRANENWIFHTELTWLYVESSSSIGTWFWSEKLGWGWTRKDLWPYIWRNSPEGWVYFFGNQDDTLTFWDYTNSEYLKL